jgi:glycolate oxidase subunit GlcD
MPTAAATSIERELTALLGADSVLAGSTRAYLTDATESRNLRGRADAVALPKDAQRVADAVRWCYEHDVPIIPRGGGTGFAGGAVPLEGGVVLSLERLQKVRHLDPGLWRAAIEAGVRTADVRRRARENGLFYPPDPGSLEQSQLGGNIATNAGGPHTFKYGVTGAWITGLEVVLAPGELVRLGGPIRKDVAGYDLKSLLIGSEGTLGVVTAVRLRLLPAPESTVAMVFFLAGREEGCAAALELLGAGLRPSVLDFLDAETLAIVAGAYPASRVSGADGPGGEQAQGAPPGAGFALIVEVDGSAADTAAQRAEAAAMLSAAVAVHEPIEPGALWRWRDGVNPAVTGMRGAKVSADVVVPIERLHDALARFEAIAAGQGLRSCAWGHAGEGNLHATVLVDPSSEQELDAADRTMQELYGVIAEMEGSIAGEHGVGLLKRGQLARQWPARAVELHEQIKRAFDPKNLLNPGKKLAR